MPEPLIQIPERMHSVAEVADLSGHGPGYVLRLVEVGELEAIRPANPRGGRGQWRIYPASIRRWLGVQDVRQVRRNLRKMRAEAAAFAARYGLPDPPEPDG